MTKKFFITQLVILICGLALAFATYQAPYHAEERKFQLEQERAAQLVRQRALPVANSR